MIVEKGVNKIRYPTKTFKVNTIMLLFFLGLLADMTIIPIILNGHLGQSGENKSIFLSLPAGIF